MSPRDGRSSCPTGSTHQASARTGCEMQWETLREVGATTSGVWERALLDVGGRRRRARTRRKRNLNVPVRAHQGSSLRAASGPAAFGIQACLRFQHRVVPVGCALRAGQRVRTGPQVQWQQVGAGAASSRPTHFLKLTVYCIVEELGLPAGPCLLHPCRSRVWGLAQLPAVRQALEFALLGAWPARNHSGRSRARRNAWLFLPARLLLRWRLATAWLPQLGGQASRLERPWHIASTHLRPCRPPWPKGRRQPALPRGTTLSGERMVGSRAGESPKADPRSLTARRLDGVCDGPCLAALQPILCDLQHQGPRRIVGAAGLHRVLESQAAQPTGGVCKLGVSPCVGQA